MSIIGNILDRWVGNSTPAQTPIRNGKRAAVPEPGDVVYLNIPTEDNPNRPGTHGAYGIVVKSVTANDLALLVVPANFKAPKPTRACEFQMTDIDACRRAGLPKPATFDLRESRITGWTTKWTAPSQFPIVGTLSDADFTRFQASYRAWLEIQKQSAEARKPAAPKAQAPVYNPEIAKLVRNRGKEREVWA